MTIAVYVILILTYVIGGFFTARSYYRIFGWKFARDEMFLILIFSFIFWPICFLLEVVGWLYER